MTGKGQLRALIREKRDKMDPVRRGRANAAIFDRIMGNPAVQNAAVVMTYVSMGSEPDTLRLIDELIAKGKKVAVPVVKGRQMEASYINSRSDLVKGNFGILEPKKEAFKYCNPEDIDVITVPGIAFDANLHRIGYGKGYYDRFLPHVNGVKIGVCYDFCIVDSVFSKEHDVAVDYIVTDLREIY